MSLQKHHKKTMPKADNESFFALNEFELNIGIKEI